ncbi:protein Wnt-6-like [Oratosquilla oratoria]|uniref:protein Wnt-6-like n=1 Tax=Oratosquilla oratoria TaxID=337810 RepID=UPI003F769389
MPKIYMNAYIKTVVLLSPSALQNGQGELNRSLGSRVTMDHPRICSRAKRVTGPQRAICRNEPQMFREILRGSEQAIRECQTQFRHFRWNCTDHRRSMKRVLMRDTPETAYLNALMAAGIAHSITSACSRGLLLHCSCRVEDELTGRRGGRRREGEEGEGTSKELPRISSDSSDKAPSQDRRESGQSPKKKRKDRKGASGSLSNSLTSKQKKNPKRRRSWSKFSYALSPAWSRKNKRRKSWERREKRRKGGRRGPGDTREDDEDPKRLENPINATLARIAGDIEVARTSPGRNSKNHLDLSSRHKKGRRRKPWNQRRHNPRRRRLKPPLTSQSAFSLLTAEPAPPRPIPTELQPEGEWRWGGCSDNVEYGYKISKAFLDSRYLKRRRKDIKTLVMLHNSEAGRLAVSDAELICKCHGLSGSCSLRTCWWKVPSFSAVAASLRTHYHRAVKVTSDNSGVGIQTLKPRQDPPSPHTLVFLEDSPDFCTFNRRTGSLGTVSRQCHMNSTGVGSCNHLCCGRGFRSYTVQGEVNCRCKFEFCCSVKCDKCPYTSNLHYCS